MLARTSCFLFVIVAACGGIEAHPGDAGTDVNMPDVALPTCLPSPAGLAARWRGDRTATEETGLYDGTATGGVAYTPGHRGSAFLLDGIDDRIIADPRDALWPTGSMSVEAWVRTSSIQSAYGYVVNKYDCGGSTGCGPSYWGLYVLPSGFPVFDARSRGSALSA